ncbi:M56 family metallopeptidase [Longimicrobium sp.]|uniref:M56 family metallopeptidase n=1 Tax=Longimicrobium sp. TaxID=2029185 RepID=UPI002CFED095|nr:M56 family metallopeptidase [Longimicrobium sp.]HSU15536.1 M56 family metallopeptidase [Longimicrobium sp.]
MSALLSDLAFPLAVVAKATLLLLAAALATLALSRRRAPAAARHLVWTLAVCGLLALPLFSVTLPGWSLGFVRLRAERWAAADPRIPAPAPSPAAAVAPRAAIADVGIPASPSPETPVTEGVGGGGVDWRTALPALYLLGVLAVLARLLAGRWSVRRLAREAAPVTSPEWTELLRDLAWMMDVGRPVTLLRGAGASMPMTWGTRRPTILLPGDADEWPDDRRRVVLLHELAHVARHDCLTQTLAAAACALYWFHPGAWYAARRLRVERELACDDRVLAAGTRAREYAEHLLEVARAFCPPPLAGAVAVSMARPSQLEGRLLAVLDHLRNRHVLTRRAGVSAAAAALALVLPLSAARPASGEKAAARDGEAPAAARRAPARSAAAAAQSGCVLRDGERFGCEIQARAGERLTLELAEGVGARVEAWERDLVRVRSESGRRLDATAGRAAGGVRVSVTAARGHDGDAPDLVIQVPRRFDVHARADGGGVEIRAVQGTFTGSTRGGGLALIEVSGTVRMDAAGGGAYIRHTRLNGRLEMGGGGVLLDENRGNLDIVNGGAVVRGSAEGLAQWGSRVRDEMDGDPDVHVAEAHGPVRNGDGDVDVDDARPGALIETGGGDIRVRRARGDITAHSGGGDVTLESVAGGATVRTGSGDVEVRLDGRGGDVDISSGSGRVTLVLPAEFSGSVDLESAYTERHAPTHVTSDFPLALSQPREWSSREGTPRRYVRGRGTLGSGRHHVRVRTVNGDVRLVRAGGHGTNVSAQVGGDRVECTGESCTLTVAGEKGSGRATVSWTSGPGGRPVFSADAVGYGYTTGDVPERLAAMDAITRDAPPAAAAQALGRFAFGDPEPRVQRAAVEGLAALRGRAGAEQLRRISREHPGAAIRRRAADALR